MSQTPRTGLAELLDDLAAGEPVAGPDLAARAWTQGRRERTHRRGRSVLAAAAVLAVLALVVPVAAVPGAAPSFARTDTAVQGHPARIGWQPWVRGLPDRPGPLAALLEVDGHEDLFGREDRPDAGHWEGVAPDGHRWRLPGTAGPGQVPTLSRDGRLLGVLLSRDGPYEVRDLVTGRRTRFPEVGAQPVLGSGPPFLQGLQSPGAFSPDGRRLVVPASTRDGNGFVQLLLDVGTGAVAPVRAPGTLVGWAAPDRLLSFPPGGGRVRLRTTDLSGRTVAEVTLPGAPTTATSQWAGVVSADGRQVALLSDGSFDGDDTVRRFDRRTGRPVGTVLTADLDGSCAGAWSRTRLVVPLRGNEPAVEVDGAATRKVTSLSRGVGGRCLLWATDALDGPAQGGPLSPALRWWREGLLAAVVLAGGVLVLRRRRAASAPGD